jgi:hypothetical protein
MAKRKGPFCGGERRGGKGPCHLPAGDGTTHEGFGRCSWHGGASPTGTKSAREQELNEQAARELARLDVEPVANAFEQLALVAGQAVAWKDSMAAKVNELLELRREDVAGTEQLRAEILLWERALDRCVATLTAMIKLNIEEKLAGIRKQTADMLERALDAALEASGAPLDGKAKAREAFKRHLKVVA